MNDDSDKSDVSRGESAKFNGILELTHATLFMSHSMFNASPFEFDDDDDDDDDDDVLHTMHCLTL